MKHTAPPVDLNRLVWQLRGLESTITQEMLRQYPVGSRVVFWRSANQKRESFGTITGHTTAHGHELRVRYDDSSHVVGLHVGYTKFHSMPNAELSHPSPKKKTMNSDKDLNGDGLGAVTCSAWRVDVIICGHRSGSYYYKTKSAALRDANSRRRKMGGLGCSYWVKQNMY